MLIISIYLYTWQFYHKILQFLNFRGRKKLIRRTNNFTAYFWLFNAFQAAIFRTASHRCEIDENWKPKIHFNCCENLAASIRTPLRNSHLKSCLHFRLPWQCPPSDAKRRTSMLSTVLFTVLSKYPKFYEIMAAYRFFWYEKSIGDIFEAPRKQGCQILHYRVARYSVFSIYFH